MSRRKPTELKLLEGNCGKRALRPRVTPPQASATPPRYLSDAAKGVWKRHAPWLIEHDLLSERDVDLFGAFCESVATWRAAREAVQRDGITIVNSRKDTVKHPALTIERAALDAMLRIGGRFGLTPADRASLDLDPDVADDFDQFLESRSTLGGAARALGANFVDAGM